ncbi:MAG TPA: hypothetical protein DGG95_03210 [Cytophagales bacterium]|nr:hypothetical protein [Cytophagales bacterium]
MNIKDINLSVFDNFLLPHECHYFIRSRESQLTPSTVCNNTDGTPVADSVRTSTGSFFENIDDLYVKYLLWKISSFTRIEQSHFEYIQILKYEVGQQYKPHHDFFFPNHTTQLAKGGQRLKTFLIYLNDVELGGETYFPHYSALVKPMLGRAVVWDNVIANNVNRKTLHAGLPVISGVKYVLTCWIRENVFA